MKFKNTIFQLLLIIVLLAFAIPVLAQKQTKRSYNKSPSVMPPCKLTLEKSPRLRGFYLGQTSADIAKAVPGFEKEYENADSNYFADKSSNFKIVHLTGLDTYPDELEEYKDVTITWQFSQNKLVRLFVTYIEFEPKNLRDFIKQISEKTNLPIESFKVTDKHKVLLTCNGFTVELQEGQYSKIGWSPESSQIILEDTVAISQLEKSTNERERQRKLEEIRKRKEEEEKRKILKP